MPAAIWPIAYIDSYSEVWGGWRALMQFPPPPPPPPPHFCVYVMLVCLFTWLVYTMAGATCTVSIPTLLPTEFISCVVSLS